jgi:hypothetical protein
MPAVACMTRSICSSRFAHCLVMGFLFPIEIFLHRRECLDDGFDPMAEPWSCEILIDHLRLGLLSFQCLPSGGNFDEGVA